MVNRTTTTASKRLRFLSALLHRASQRISTRLNQVSAGKIQDSVDHGAVQLPSPALGRPPRFNLKVFDLVDTTNLRHHRHDVRQGGIRRDVEYYRDEREAGLCVFLVENTLFKVHKCYLLREPSVFGDMFCLPFVGGNHNNESEPIARAIPLSDTAEQFRDLLWALYAVPAQLCAAPSDGSAPSLERLLNVAQLANKYCIASYEAWALGRILLLAQTPNGFLRQAPPESCARALAIAVLGDHRELVDVITQKLVARLLWSSSSSSPSSPSSDMTNRQPILQVATRFGLTTLQGVVHYRELVDLERRLQRPGLLLAFLSDVPHEEKRLRLFSAYHSILSLWDRIRVTPPPLVVVVVAEAEHDNGASASASACSTHAECLETWSKLWVSAASSEQTSKHGVVDVLGRLKSMMIQLKKAMTMTTCTTEGGEEEAGMSLGCTLSALESITTARDEIVAGLLGHFQLPLGA